MSLFGMFRIDNDVPFWRGLAMSAVFGSCWGASMGLVITGVVLFLFWVAPHFMHTVGAR